MTPCYYYFFNFTSVVWLKYVPTIGFSLWWQWAAVTMCCGWIKVPAQICAKNRFCNDTFNKKKHNRTKQWIILRNGAMVLWLTCPRNSPTLAGFPPMIRKSPINPFCWNSGNTYAIEHTENNHLKVELFNDWTSINIYRDCTCRFSYQKGTNIRFWQFSLSYSLASLLVSAKKIWNLSLDAFAL